MPYTRGKIVGMDPDPKVSRLYCDYFRQRKYAVWTTQYLSAIPQDTDVVIAEPGPDVDVETFVKEFVECNPTTPLILATQRGDILACKTYNVWAISKPFYMDEIEEIVDVIMGRKVLTDSERWSERS